MLKQHTPVFFKEAKKPPLKEDVDVAQVITDLIDTKWSGSNNEQMKAVQLLKGLATSDDPRANKFMKALDDFSSTLDKKEFTEGSY